MFPGEFMISPRSQTLQGKNPKLGGRLLGDGAAAGVCPLTNNILFFVVAVLLIAITSIVIIDIIILPATGY